MTVTYITLILLGLLLAIGGLILRVAPPKDINCSYGYRSQLSKKSQGHWDFAQDLASKYIILIAPLSASLACFVVFFLKDNWSELTLILLGSSIILIGLGLAINRVEAKLKGFASS